MIDHVSIAVADLAPSARQYEAVLSQLGLQRLVDRPAAVGFGRTYPEFWLNARPGWTPGPGHSGAHVCLRASSEDAVRAFFETALRTGFASGGEPGPRQGTMTRYFAAFIVDAGGNRIEAACFPKAQTGSPGAEAPA